MPVTTTGLALLAAGNAALGYIGNRSAADAAKRQGEFEAQALEYNASIADMQAADALEIGEDQQQLHMLEVRRLIGEQRTTLAGSGVDISSGTALDIQEDSAFLGEIDRQMIASNAAREAWGFKAQAGDIRNRARLTRAGAKNIAQSYRNQAISTMIGGAVDVATIYRNK